MLLVGSEILQKFWMGDVKFYISHSKCSHPTQNVTSPIASHSKLSTSPIQIFHTPLKFLHLHSNFYISHSNFHSKCSYPFNVTSHNSNFSHPLKIVHLPFKLHIPLKILHLPFKFFTVPFKIFQGPRVCEGEEVCELVARRS